MSNFPAQRLTNHHPLQLTDQVAKVLLPESKDVNDFQQKVLDTERLLADRLRVEELHSVVCKQVADLVDIEIPEFLYRTVGENEYQAELLTSQANVRHISIPKTIPSCVESTQRPWKPFSFRI